MPNEIYFYVHPMTCNLHCAHRHAYYTNKTRYFLFKERLLKFEMPINCMEVYFKYNSKLYFVHSKFGLEKSCIVAKIFTCGEFKLVS